MKKALKKGILRRGACLALAVIMAVMCFAACADRVKDPVLEHGDHKISLSMYEFMLSRMKGALAKGKYDVTPLSSFWDETHAAGGMTNEEYYNSSVLDSCKNYLAALVIFDKEGLALSSAVLSEIESEISFYIDYDGNGSEEKLDAILSKYGTDTEGLRRIYEIEAKYAAVMSHLYGENGSQISDAVKEEYYIRNYYRFKQILVSNFYYEYIEDGEGNIIYFDPESSEPIYSAEGKYHYDEDGKRIVDGYDVAIRYDDEGNALYDKENGAPAPVCDKDGNAIKNYYSEDEMAQRAKDAEALASLAQGGHFSAFEAEMKNWQVYDGAGEYYKDGYYLSDIESGAYDDSMQKMLSELKKMNVGDSCIIKSENGYHVIVKYELDSGKYSDDDYSEWFSSFNQSLTTKLFVDKCKKMYPDMTVTDIFSEKAKSIRSVGNNFDY